MHDIESALCIESLKGWLVFIGESSGTVHTPAETMCLRQPKVPIGNRTHADGGSDVRFHHQMRLLYCRYGHITVHSVVMCRVYHNRVHGRGGTYACICAL